MEEIKIDIREWNRWLKDQFYNKDLITFEELIGKFEDIVLENEDLKEQIKDLENKDDYDEHQDIPEIHGEGISW
jgi:hypothetical protein